MTSHTKIEDLIALHGEAEVLELFEKRYPESYEVFLKHIQLGIDAAVGAIERNAKHYSGFLEDQITTILVENLVAQRFDASHDADYSGHIDVSIQSQCKKFFWGAEAKINYNHKWLSEGVEQLENSYLDGTTNRNHAGLLIYIKHDNAAGRMKNWADFYAREKSSDGNFSIASCKHRENYAYVSSQTLQRTGMPYELRHIGISLWRKHSVELLVNAEESAEAKKLEEELKAQEKLERQALKEKRQNKN